MAADFEGGKPISAILYLSVIDEEQEVRSQGSEKKPGIQAILYPLFTTHDPLLSVTETNLELLNLTVMNLTVISSRFLHMQTNAA